MQNITIVHGPWAITLEGATGLSTDTRNLAEINNYHIRQARTFYQERIDLGHHPGDARAQALAYLRRKTHWPEPLAAGAFDSPSENNNVI